MKCGMALVTPGPFGEGVQEDCPSDAVCTMDGIPACQTCRDAIVHEEGEDFMQIIPLEGHN